MQLYSFQGRNPESLPFRIAHPLDGRVFTAETAVAFAEECGWIQVDPPPPYDPATHNPPTWEGAAMAWAAQPKSEEQLAAEWAAAETALEEAVERAVEAYLDDTARERRYSGIVSLCSYYGSNHPKFGPEAAAGMAFRDATWDYCYDQLARIKAGTRKDQPTPDEFVAELRRERPMAWPTPPA